VNRTPTESRRFAAIDAGNRVTEKSAWPDTISALAIFTESRSVGSITCGVVSFKRLTTVSLTVAGSRIPKSIIRSRGCSVVTTAVPRSPNELSASTPLWNVTTVDRAPTGGPGANATSIRKGTPGNNVIGNVVGDAMSISNGLPETIESITSGVLETFVAVKNESLRDPIRTFPKSIEIMFRAGPYWIGSADPAPSSRIT
jgi:hypothetical protein